MNPNSLRYDMSGCWEKMQYIYRDVPSALLLSSSCLNIRDNHLSQSLTCYQLIEGQGQNV